MFELTRNWRNVREDLLQALVLVASRVGAFRFCITGRLFVSENVPDV